MDYNLYIILSKEDLEKIGIFELKASWAGKDISYDPKRFMFEDTVQMWSFKDKTRLGMEGHVDENKVILTIKSGLRELEWEVNKKTEDLKSNGIMRMLQKICQLSKFSIYIFEDDETIEQEIEYMNEENIISLVGMALNWESPQNIKIFCQ